MRVIVASPGTGVFIQETTKAYLEHGALDTFFTSFVANLDLPCYQFLQQTRLAKDLSRREVESSLLPYVRTKPFYEMLRTLFSRTLSAACTDWMWEISDKSFDRWVASNLDAAVDTLHCYEHCSLRMMERAKALGLFVVYEQPSQHHSYLTPVIKAQLAQFPALANDQALLQIEKKAIARNARRDAELDLADLVICNSSFTSRTLIAAGISEKIIRVIPLGFPAPATSPPQYKEKLRILYAGTSSIRKGVHLLLQVWRELFADRHDVELMLVGKFELASSCLDDVPANVLIVDSIPRSELLKNFCEAEVLVLPTLADGFGMVISEAMSRGLCVMCTDNSAGPDIISHGYDGLIFKSGDKESLRSVLAEWSDRRDELRAMGERAMLTAARYQWADYRKRLVSVVEEASDAGKYRTTP